MATIIVRKLGPNFDPIRGFGLANFWVDIDAVAAIVAQRLLLLQGEWFEDTSLGVPLFGSLLGQSITTQAVALILQKVILGAPYVTGITSLNISLAGPALAFNATIQTAFGPITVSNQQPFQLSNTTAA